MSHLLVLLVAVPATIVRQIQVCATLLRYLPEFFAGFYFCLTNFCLLLRHS